MSVVQLRALDLGCNLTIPQQRGVQKVDPVGPILLVRYLAEFRGTLARAQQLLAAFSDASEAEHDSQAHGVLVGGLLDFAKGLHSAAGKVAGSVRSVASSTGRKSSNSEQDDDGLGPEVTGSGRRANAGGGDTAKKGGAQAKKVLLSLGNRLGSLGESLGGECVAI